MVHHIFTIIAPLGGTPDPPPESPAAAAPRFASPITDADSQALAEQFTRLPMIHFASIQAFSGDAPRPDACFQPCLVLECCIDGAVDECLDALVATDAGPLGQVFARCRDFAPGHRRRSAYLRAYLSDHLHAPQLYHIGNPDLRVEHVQAGHHLREALDGQLDTVVARGRSLDPPRGVVDEMRRVANVPPSTKQHWHAEIQPAAAVPFSWFADPIPVGAARLRAWLRLALLLSAVLTVAAGLVWIGLVLGLRSLILALLGLAVALSLVRRWLRGRHTEPVTVDRHAILALKALEDCGVQNHMASLLMLKEGWARKLSIRAVLYVFNIIYRTWYTDVTPGRLQGLPTIHFAHWTIVSLVDRNGRRREGLLFLSNYDGSWETYLDDFLAYVFSGVVTIWANAEGFPWPLDGPTFKRWARGCMSPWQFWYRAYPDLTVLNIENNDHIRRGLLRAPLTDAEARLWLARFGSIKRGDETLEPPLGALETHDIQGLVFSGYRRLPHAAYIALRIERPEAARLWLINLLPHVTDARERRKAELQQQTLAYNVAFTWSGLRALGLPDAALAQFSDPFQEGLAPDLNPHRSRVLGDAGPNAPDRWAWGNGGDRADILLMIFAKEETVLAAEVRAQVGAFTCRQAGRAVATLSGQLLLDTGDPEDSKFTREHFGFMDGVSQPEIEGARPTGRGAQHADDLLKPGEFLLGYPGNEGTLTPGIPVPVEHDQHRLLPVAVDRPEMRDFGRNGSYLVFRQLAQDVAAFRRSTAKAAGARDWESGSGAAERVAARMIGRWRDGTPLLANGAAGRSMSAAVSDSPAGAAAETQSGFTDDPHGFGCPIGSHVRRANPRDSLQPDPSLALRSANRHRLLRRGRPYGKPMPAATARDDGQERGMAFICLNSDIERQFEFVQQNWINNPAFGGLYGERDPLIGTAAGAGGCLTVQAPGVRERMNGIAPFVTVKGGDYFFLPGISALRYLSSLNRSARLPAGQMPLREVALAPPPPQFPSALRRGLTRLQRQLRSLRSAWGARFPLALGAALVGLAFAPIRQPTIALNLFVMDRVGVAAVALLASLVAFVVMITLRLVSMYGWRSSQAPPRRHRPATWGRVFGFQALALPVTAAVLHYSTRDLIDGLPQPGGYWHTIGNFLPAALFGMFAAVAILLAVTVLQALRPDSGAGLFFPPTRLLTIVGGPGWRPRRLWQWSSRFSRLSQWIVDGVPEEIGRGYIDYRHRRILPGHVFALSLSLAIAVLYLFGAVALSPERCVADDWLPAVASRLMCGLSERVPALAYLLFLFVGLGWLLASLSFFFDRYRVATVLVLGVWLAMIASVARTDHVFPVGPVVQPEPLPPGHAVRAARDRQAANKVIVVASDGLGLAASAWTVQVLAELARLDGFTSSLRLVSAASGAALGTVYFIDAFQPPGASRGPLDPARLEAIKQRARTPSTSQLGWGIVYPDLARTFVPWVVPPLRDRGWAMEQAWQRAAASTAPTDPSAPPATLASWRQGVAEGWRPAIAFGVTLVETGGRGLLATYDPPAELPQLTNRHDLSVFTAARLSAAFPYVSPAARADTSQPAYHLADGGYWDSSGLVSTMEWLESAAPELRETPVMLIEISSSKPRIPKPPEDNAWTFDFTGPVRTMFGVRADAQPARRGIETAMFADRWQARIGQPLHRARFALDVEAAPLAWNLGRADQRRLAESWNRDEIRQQIALVRQFLNQ